MTTDLVDQLLARISGLSAEAKAALIRESNEFTGAAKWVPTVGPQADAYYSKADVLLYGGQGGGGKTDLLLGLAFTTHRRSLIVRRHYTDLSALTDRALEIHGSRKGYNGAIPPSLRIDDNRIIEFGACANAGDEEHWQGRPHDLLGLEEAAQLLEAQVRYLMGWVRTTDKDVPRTRVVMATNPPLTDEGQWLFQMFRPWVDPEHEDFTLPGVLRWYVTDEDGKDHAVEGPDVVEIGGRKVKPMSRTFIGAALSDNPFLAETDYHAKMDALPEPLRSAIRDGDFRAGRRDDLKQVIPSSWAFAAQTRWTERPPEHAPMRAMGVDVAQGGPSDTVIACRYDGWYANLIVTPGRDTPQGSDVAALVLKHRRNKALPIIDMGGGYGGGVFEHLEANGIPVQGFKGATTVGTRTKDRQLGFFNKRAEAAWRFREALDPDQPGGSPIALPRDPDLIADLVSLRFEPTTRGIKIETKEDVVDRLGRSPDRGDAVIMAWAYGDTTLTHGQIWRKSLKAQHRPQVRRGYESRRRRH